MAHDNSNDIQVRFAAARGVAPRIQHGPDLQVDGR